MKWPVPAEWPYSGFSQRIYSTPHRWHVQQMGQGPLILLLHGAGGSTHSFAGVMPLLATRFTVVAVDLPGHGFTQLGARHRSGLVPMAEDLLALCASQGWQPECILAHSAGSAVALEMSETLLSPRGRSPDVIGVNAALSGFNGIAGVLFPAMAKALAALPFTAKIFSVMAGRRDRVQSLISGTGSVLSATQIDHYARLIADRDHVDGTLLMMSQWDLQPLLQRLPALQTRTLLMAAELDKTVPPEVSTQAAKIMPNATLKTLDTLGHLAHEEDPKQLVRAVFDFLVQSPS